MDTIDCACGGHAVLEYRNSIVCVFCDKCKFKVYGAPITQQTTLEQIEKTIHRWNREQETMRENRNGLKEQEVFKKALGKYGAEAQTKKLLEEMAELQEAICKQQNGRDTVEHVAEEIADVLVMLDQMMIMYDCRDLVKDIKREKVERLAGKLDERR